MDNQKKKTNTKKRKHTSSSWKKKSQGIKDSVKSKIAQNSKPITSVNSQTSVNNSTSINTQDTSKPAEKPAATTTTTTTTEKTTPHADTSKAKKSPLWNKTKLVGKGVLPRGVNYALDKVNDTSSLYYDSNTGMYVKSSDMQPIWQKNLANNNNLYNAPYFIFNKVPDAVGDLANNVLGLKNPTARELLSTGVDIGSYFIPYYGVGKGIYDIGDKVSNTIWDTNRDMDMLQDLRYGDLGYSNKWLLDNDTGSWLDGPAAFGESLWEGIKTASANDWVYNLTGLGRRSGFSEQSDVYKLGQQTTIKMMQKMLEDTNNFDPANVNSRATLNKFNMMNQLLKNSDRYWELQSIKRDNDMSDESFNNYLNNAGIDTNMYRGMEYAAKQLYNLGDNQERNGLKYDNSIISTQAPMLQYKYARKQKPIKDDPLGNLVGGNHILDGYHKVGNTFVNTNPKKVLEPVTEIQENKKDDTPKKETSVEPVLEFMSPNDPGYIKGDPMTFTKEYNKRHGIKDVTDFYDIWK